MKTSDFDYSLPAECIAQTPREPRHSSRLLVLHRDREGIEHTTFWNIDNYLKSGDLLVINQTQVIPARLFARKKTGGRVEILLLRKENSNTWEALVGGAHLEVGKQLQIEKGPAVVVAGVMDGSRRRVVFSDPIEPYLGQIGQMPLPPYIHTRLDDPQRYQTVYASQSGSVAAPTAGLHFTLELMQRLKSKGVEFTSITLHIGLDTFQPVNEEDPLAHKIHSEWCEVSQGASEIINATRRRGGRVVAVGTTCVRTLETAAQYALPGDTVGEFSGASSLFILPGYSFLAVDGMITNFHLPRSTLLMLVSAFAGREHILDVYRQAVETGYRFYSFGDVMLIL